MTWGSRQLPTPVPAPACRHTADVSQLAVPNGDGKNPVIFPGLVRGFDAPRGKAHDQNPLSLRYVFGRLRN